MSSPFPRLVREAGRLLSLSWKEIYEAKKEELLRIFAEHGDRAYGVWIQQFMAPVCAFLQEKGYRVKDGFNRNDSIERWGPPEERERVAWYVVRDANDTPAGTMLLQVYHSHASFCIPRAPRLLALEATDRETILSALAVSANRVRWDLPQERPVGDEPDRTDRWEYATDVSLGDALRAEDSGGLSSWMLDEALSSWGRYGWELVGVAPSGSETIAFFKRPIRQL
ncbi:hypothetical protein H7C18_34270 [Cohnella sp. CBP 2801]|uniref:Uncharacterized protein n=1 Tax=Cohnella zeiphila TaxID=2761120 RepID=A0A7X0VZ21_9BACL|nr:hypothetical protein [Cohnella zeiphila]